MNRGLFYNQDGKEAVGNETRLTLGDLNGYLQNLNITGNNVYYFLKETLYLLYFNLLYLHCQNGFS